MAADANAMSNCCHCVNIDDSLTGKCFKAKRIIDESIKENGKKQFKIQWEETWVEETYLLTCMDLLEEYKKIGKPKIQLLAHAENSGDDSQVYVIRVSNTGILAGCGNLAVCGLQGHDLIDKMSELAKTSKQLSDSDQEDVKLVTYAQLEKAGFLVEDEDAEKNNNEISASCSSTALLPHTNSDVELENARQQMYSQVASGNSNKVTLNYVHNDIEPRGNKRFSFIQRRRQPFQLHRCSQCGSEFVHRTHLKIHQRTHTGEKPYKCNFCERCFAQKGNLHVHMKIHTGERDFVCEYCNRSFITNAQLFVHLRTHTNPNRKRPYVDLLSPKSILSNPDSDNLNGSNQIIVQMVRVGKKNELKADKKEAGLQNASDIPTLVVAESELENLVDANEAMNSLVSLNSASQHQQPYINERSAPLERFTRNNFQNVNSSFKTVS